MTSPVYVGDTEIDMPDADLALLAEMGARANSPLDWVDFSFPWGSGELERFDGPDTWQKKFLVDLGEEITDRGFDGFETVLPVLQAVGSGHGVGKSALVAWLILFIMSTRPLCRGVVTATTATQLASKTVPELSKWLRRCITSDWFRLTTGRGSMRLVHRDPRFREEWRTDFQTCREENSEAFAGQHAITSSSFYIFDESAGVPDKIWEVSEGGTTDGEPFWFAFGNRTRSVGRFHECWGKFSHRWLKYNVDSRDSRFTNKDKIREWEYDYGPDSDFFRVRVLGLPPRAASTQFISEDIIREAQRRRVGTAIDEPLVMGVDVARHGGDRSVIRFRKGRNANIIAPIREEYTDNLSVFADQVAELILKYKVDACFVDGGGLGAGVVDILTHRHMMYMKVWEVNFGGGSSDRRYFNKRSQMWGNGRDWLKTGEIDDSDDLRQDLIIQEYLTDPKSRTIRMVGKETMRDLGIRSTDDADALFLTLASHVAILVNAAGGPHHPDPAVKQGQIWHPHDRLPPSGVN
jgi:hypothetical protein